MSHLTSAYNGKTRVNDAWYECYDSVQCIWVVFSIILTARRTYYGELVCILQSKNVLCDLCLVCDEYDSMVVY